MKHILMRKSLKIALSASIAFTCSSLTAQASNITNIVSSDNGALVIERAGNFQIATIDSPVLTHDRILSINGTSANIMLSPDCVVSLSKNQVLNVVSTISQDCASMYTLETLTAGDLDAVGASNLSNGTGVIIAILLGGAIAGIAAAGGGGDDDTDTDTDTVNSPT